MSQAALSAAAQILSNEGTRHGWFSTPLESLDPIGRDEFLALVARIANAAEPDAQRTREQLSAANDIIEGLVRFERDAGSRAVAYLEELYGTQSK